MGVLDFVDDFTRLNTELSEWSQKTFGSDDERGPIGALKHLAKEAKEAAESVDRGELLKELADCLILTLDATRRGKFTASDLLQAALEKMEVNRNRKWPAPVKDEPVEHVKEDAALLGNDWPTGNGSPEYDSIKPLMLNFDTFEVKELRDEDGNVIEESNDFCLSTDGEHYDSRFLTEQEAIDEAVALGCEVFYIGKPEKPEQPEDFWCVDEWISHVSDQDDYGGEYAEDWYNGTREQEMELEEQVRPVLAAWLDRHKLRPKHWLINSSTKYIVVEGQVMTEAQLNGMEE